MGAPSKDAEEAAAKVLEEVEALPAGVLDGPNLCVVADPPATSPLDAVLAALAIPDRM